jgi:hypothetical protein
MSIVVTRSLHKNKLIKVIKIKIEAILIHYERCLLIGSLEKHALIHK